MHTRIMRSRGGKTVLATTCAILTACASGVPAQATTTKAVTITFWNSGPSAGINGGSSGIPQLIKDFNKQYQGHYKIVYKIIPYYDETAVVNSALGAHNEPDLITESLTFGSGYAYEGVVEPIGPILKMAGINPATDFPKSLWDASVVQGQHYMAPTNAIPTVLFWNKALFKKAGLNPDVPPATGPQLVADAEKITSLGHGTWGYVEEPTGGGMNYSLQSVMDQYGAYLANAKTGKVTFNTPGGVAAVQFFRNLIFKYHVSPPNASPEEAHNLFVKGEDGMEITGSYDYPTYHTILGNNLGISLVPKIGHNQQDFLGQNYWWVFRAPGMNETMERGIALFMKYYYANSLYLARQGFFPTWLPLWNTRQFKEIPTYSLQAQAVNDGVLHPPIPIIAELNHKYFFPDIELALLGKEPTGKAVAAAASAMQSAIQENFHA
jgi:multiple sugar transport system substrate-binding protein